MVAITTDHMTKKKKQACGNFLKTKCFWFMLQQQRKYIAMLASQNLNLTTHKTGISLKTPTHNKAPFPSSVSKRKKTSLLYKMTINIKKWEKPLNIIIFTYDKLLVPQNEQTKHKRCHCFKRQMPVVWKRSRLRQIYRNLPSSTSLGHVRMTKTTFQLLCNEIGPWVSQVFHPIMQSHITFLMRKVEFIR